MSLAALVLILSVGVLVIVAWPERRSGGKLHMPTVTRTQALRALLERDSARPSIGEYLKWLARVIVTGESDG